MQISIDFKDLSQAKPATQILIGCAGWSISAAYQHRFLKAGTHLERYAQVLPAVEINSSFYRPHLSQTYARWRESVPDAFRFSVKLPRSITHEHRLNGAKEELLAFLNSIAHLKEKLGCLLVQLPPSLQYNDGVARPFLETLRSHTAVDIACEPRHATWFTEEAAALFFELSIARVVADPPIVEQPAPMQFDRVMYIRLHGSPVIYHSDYSQDFLDSLSKELKLHQRESRRAWCIFDNTASGAALGNALAILNKLAF